MKVKIITDSCCDLPYADEQAYKEMIDIMSFDITLGEETFRERIDITPQEFFEKLDKSEYLPKTAQITVPRFEEKFTECFNKGYDAIICVLINSTGSQTYSNALLAKHKLEEELDGFKDMRLEIIDTHCYSVAYGYPVLEAAKKLETGQSVDSVVDYLVDMFNCCEIYVIGFELRHMKKSGRINAAAAFLGELMGLKPIISLIDGESAVVKKSRGEKNAIKDAAEYIARRATPETPWQFLRSTMGQLDEEFIKIYSGIVGSKPVMDSYCGAAVASNTGPHMMGIVIRGKARR